MKKLASILALAAVVANLGIATVLAQTVVNGTQQIGCSTTDATTWRPAAQLINYEPTGFQIGSDGSRQIRNVNDTDYVEADNSAYFEQTAPGVFVDPVDTVGITGITSPACGNAGNAVALTVSATRFTNGGGALLESWGANGVDAVDDTGDDYYPIFSVITGATACNGSCVLATGSTEPAADVAAKAGNLNAFGVADANTVTASAGWNLTSLLLAPNTLLGAGGAVIQPAVTLYSNTMGMNGSVDITGLDFSLMLPANIALGNTTYTSVVTYTLT